MKYLIIIFSSFVFSYWFTGCNSNSTTEPINDTIDCNVLADNLLLWSASQSSPFVICGKGDTTGGHATESSDLITNIISSPQDWRYGTYRDSLFIDTTGLEILKTTVSKLSSNSFIASFNLSMSEQDMIAFLNKLDLRLRMMKYDSLTNELETKLIAWSYNQNPHKTLHTGLYYFVHEVSFTTGGYRLPGFTFRAVQNLQYYTRNIDKNTLLNIVTNIDTSLSSQQLKTLFSPISTLEIHDTMYDK